jgi:hypothetical protein
MYQATNANLTLLAGAGTGSELQVLRKASGNATMEWATMSAGGLDEAAASLLYQATNAALTALATDPAMYQATNAVLTALVADPSMYQSTNVDLTSLTSWITGNDIATPGTITASGFISSGSGESGMEALTITNSTRVLNVTASKLLTTDTNQYVTNVVSLDYNVPLVQQTTVSNIVDVSKPSSLITVGGNIAYIYATNGVDGTEQYHTVRLRNYSGSDVTFSIPSTWVTNIYAGAPVNLTNGTLTTMYVGAIGATGDAASQTNVVVAFDYSK